MSVGTIRMASRGFVLIDNISIETRFVECNIHVGHAAA
jgi:hypothetical protein